MPPLVHGNDAFTGMDMVIETTYNTDPGTGYLRVPLLGEAIFVKREQFPKNREIGSLGAQPVVDFGRATVEGSFTVYPRYNAVWFNQLLVHAFGGAEEVQSGFCPDGTSPGGSFSTHAYLPQNFKEIVAGSASGVPPGLTLRVAKSGNTTGGSREVYTGCVIKRITWEHPENDRPKVTFDVVGQFSSIATVSGALEVAGAGVAVRARDLKNRSGIANAPGLLKVGSGLTFNPNITAFKIVVESNIDFAPGFLNSPDVIEKPGHTDLWRVTGQITSLLQQSEFGAGTPGLDFVARTNSAIRIRYASDTNVVAAIPYAADFYAKNIVWTKAENGITEGGAPATTYDFECGFGTFTTAESALNANQKNVFMLQTIGQIGAYTTSAQGGNIVVIPGS